MIQLRAHRSRRTTTLLAIGALGLVAPAGIAAADHIAARRLPINEVGTGTAADDVRRFLPSPRSA